MTCVVGENFSRTCQQNNNADKSKGGQLKGKQGRQDNADKITRVLNLNVFMLHTGCPIFLARPIKNSQARILGLPVSA